MPYLMQMLSDQMQPANYGAQAEGKTGAIALKFGPTNFDSLDSGNLPYSKAFESINWKDILSTKIEDKIKQRVAIQNLFVDVVFNSANALIGIMYLLSFIVYLIKGFIIWSDEDYYNHSIEPFSILFADAPGFYLAMFLLTSNSAGFALYKLRKAFLQSKLNAKTLIEEFNSKRSAMIDTYDNMVLFFSFSEIIYKLEQPEAALHLKTYKKELAQLFKKYKLNEIIKLDKLASHDLPLLKTAIYTYLHDKRFKFFLDKIKKNIKDDFKNRLSEIRELIFTELKLQEHGVTGNLGYLTKEQLLGILKKLDIYCLIHFCNRVDQEEPLQNLIFYLIGETSCNPTDPNASILLHPINTFEDGIDEVVKQAITDYWNDKETPKLKHPHNVVLRALAEVVNSKIINNHFVDAIYRSILESVTPSSYPRLLQPTSTGGVSSSTQMWRPVGRLEQGPPRRSHSQPPSQASYSNEVFHPSPSQWHQP